MALIHIGTSFNIRNGWCNGMEDEQSRKELILYQQCTPPKFHMQALIGYNMRFGMH